MSLSNLATIDAQHHFHPYTNPRQLEASGPLVITRGEGVRVFDNTGKSYIEGMAGLWCAGLGFSESRLVEAAHRQMKALPYYHSFNGRVPDVVPELVDKLMHWSPLPKAHILFANSGSESNDTAYKLVRYYNYLRGRPEKTKVIGRERGYHGTTTITASMSGLKAAQQNFNLPLPGFLHVGAPHFYAHAAPGETLDQFTDRLARELEDCILKEGPETIGAFIAEPVQGGGGVIIPPPGYFAKIQVILKKYDILFIADEVISGFGRLGDTFGTRVFDLKPDMITTAKMLSAAYAPISALFISDELYQTVAAGAAALGTFGHGYTYSGHPMAAAVALETLRIYEEDGIIDHVKTAGAALQEGLRKFTGHPLVGDVRGLGLIAALELAEKPEARQPFAPQRGVGAYFAGRAMEHGLIVRSIPGDIIALAPPLIISEAEIAAVIAILRQALQETEAWVKGA